MDPSSLEVLEQDAEALCNLDVARIAVKTKTPSLSRPSTTSESSAGLCLSGMTTPVQAGLSRRRITQRAKNRHNRTRRVPFDLLEDFARSGVMPSMASLIAQGTFTKMLSSIPEVSSVAVVVHDYRDQSGPARNLRIHRHSPEFLRREVSQLQRFEDKPVLGSMVRQIRYYQCSFHLSRSGHERRARLRVCFNRH